MTDTAKQLAAIRGRCEAAKKQLADNGRGGTAMNAIRLFELEAIRDIPALLALADAQAANLAKAIDALVDLTNEVCTNSCDGKLHSWASSGRADAIRTLAKFGRVTITHDDNHVVNGEWVKP